MNTYTPDNNTIRDIKSLIPQRPPIMMVDEYTFEDAQNCSSRLTIAADNIFLDENHIMIAEGVLEHIAQSAAAHIGYRRKLAGAPVNFGYIGDIKRCQMSDAMPLAGDTLTTHISIVSEVENIVMISAETTSQGKTVVTCRMKLAN